MPYILIFFIFIISCASKPPYYNEITNEISCDDKSKLIMSKNTEFQLNSLTILYDRGCYEDVISIGKMLRNKFRDKYYSLINEVAETVVYEGVLKDYVLESHERVFGSLLMAMSYIKLNKKSEAEIEMNIAYDESVAQIYNSGADEVNVFIQGLLWLRLVGIEKASPFFEKIENENGFASDHLVEFVKYIKKEITNSKAPITLNIQTLNHLPEVTFSWLRKYNRKYSSVPRLMNCLSDNGILLTTNSWLQNIERRDLPDHDKVLTLKRTLRFPLVVTYTSLVFAVGAGLTYLSSQALPNDITGLLGALTIFATHKTFVNGLAPDMRYWSDLPEAFYVSTKPISKIKNEPCLRIYDEANLIQRDLL